MDRAVRPPLPGSRSRARLLPRLGAVGLGLLLAAPLVWWFWPAPAPPAPPNTTAVVDHMDSQARILHLRATGEAPLGEPLNAVPGSVLGRAVIPQEHALLLHAGFSDSTVYDPWTVFDHAPDLRLRIRWPEHPQGGWWLRTNSLGMREDDEPASAPPPRRVLVLGDSHTDGVCEDRESFANRFEAFLRQRWGGAPVEVLNAGKGGHTVYNYLGAAQKHEALDPDLVVVTYYGGNDLVEAPLYRQYFEGRERPPEHREFARRIGVVAKKYPSEMSQALSQVAYLAWTGELDYAVETSARVLRELAAWCAARDSGFVVVYLPAPTQIEWERFAPRFEGALELLGLDRSATEALDRARDALAAAAARDGYLWIDAGAALRAAAAAGGAYWAGDLHIDLNGHRAVAQALFEGLAASPLRTRILAH
jgi:lysophospholipase L1-like esterase